MREIFELVRDADFATFHAKVYLGYKFEESY